MISMRTVLTFVLSYLAVVVVLAIVSGHANDPLGFLLIAVVAGVVTVVVNRGRARRHSHSHSHS